MHFSIKAELKEWNINPSTISINQGLKNTSPPGWSPTGLRFRTKTIQITLWGLSSLTKEQQGSLFIWKATENVGQRDGEAFFFFRWGVDGSLALVRRGSPPAACSQKPSLWLFICGLAALQWKPYHYNGHWDRTREHVQHIASLFSFLFFSSSPHSGEQNWTFHFLFVATSLSSVVKFHQQLHRSREGFYSLISPTGPHCVTSLTSTLSNFTFILKALTKNK